MAPSFEEVISSGQFTFLVGENKRPVVVHAGAIVATSEALDKLVNGCTGGRMSEARTRTAELKDITYEDFIHFCEYAYFGDYSVSLPSEELIAPPALVQKTASIAQIDEDYQKIDDDSSDLHYASAEKKKKRSKIVDWHEPAPQPLKTALHSEFDNLKYLTTDDNRPNFTARFQTDANISAAQDPAEILLAHARLYSFAEMHFVKPLKNLILHKLHKTLISFQPPRDKLGGIVGLARYAYSNENTSDRAPDGTVDELRRLFVLFFAREKDTIGKTAEFQELLEEGGEFVSDFWNIARAHVF